MSNVCRACLAGIASADNDVKFYNIENKLLEMYEKLISTKVSTGDGRCNTLCYICHAQLLKCSSFSDMACRSDECLRTMLPDNKEVNNEMATALRLKQARTLSVMSLKPLYLNGLSTSRSTKSIIKKGQLTDPITRDFAAKYNKKTKGGVFKEAFIKEVLITKQPPKEEMFEEKIIDFTQLILDEELLIPDTRICNDPNELNDTDECKYIHLTPEDLPAHLNTIEASKPRIYCPYCSIVFRFKSQFNQHIRTHTQTKRTKEKTKRVFICDKCGRSTRTKQNLIEHLRVHTGERIYCQICNKGFTQTSSLSKHVHIHTGGKPYTCHICGSNFKQSGQLTSHIRFVHEGIRPHSCELCDKRFSGKSKWRLHMDSHSGTKTHSCEYCHAKFLTNYSKTRHIKNHCKRVCVSES